MDGADAVAWSPDGARIAVVDDDIWTMTPDGREAQQITHSASEVKSSPVWRSDGTLTFLDQKADDQLEKACNGSLTASVSPSETGANAGVTERRQPCSRFAQ